MIVFAEGDKDKFIAYLFKLECKKHFVCNGCDKVVREICSRKKFSDEELE